MNRAVADKKITIEGFPLKVHELVIYRCDRCGKSVLPEASKDQLRKIKEELFSTNGDGPVA